MVLSLMARPALHAQMTTAGEKFEVASIKRCQNNRPPSGGYSSSAGLRLACVTTANLIRLAYLVFPSGERNAPVSPTSFQMPISGGHRGSIPIVIPSKRRWSSRSIRK